MYNLGDLYNSFNNELFNGELPELVLVVRKIKGEKVTSYSRLKWDGRLSSRTYGTYSPSAQPGKGIIRLARFMAGDPTLVRSTLLHEMLHQWLDLKGLDDGVRGHGENFILHSKRINLICQEKGYKFRVNFFNKEIVSDTPQFNCELISETIYSVKDLDIARTLEKVVKSAFNENYETVY